MSQLTSLLNSATEVVVLSKPNGATIQIMEPCLCSWWFLIHKIQHLCCELEIQRHVLVLGLVLGRWQEFLQADCHESGAASLTMRWVRHDFARGMQMLRRRLSALASDAKGPNVHQGRLSA